MAIIEGHKVLRAILGMGATEMLIVKGHSSTTTTKLSTCSIECFKGAAVTILD
jgi:hypothetical protein